MFEIWSEMKGVLCYIIGMRIAICDDDVLFLDKTIECLNKWKNKPVDLVIQDFNDGDSLLNAHKKDPFDLIFIDIVMPMLNGIDTCKEIRMFDKNVKLVFLTTSKEFAIESYQVKAFNYLLKPIDEHLLYCVLDEFLEDYLVNSKTITVKALYSTFKIKLMDIEYIESDNKHVLVHCIDNRLIRSTTPLYSIEKDILKEDCFFKSHRSYIINLYYVDSFTNKDVTMQNGTIIPISRSLKKEFEETYFSIMFKEGD